jgi:hypothetical protein
LQELEGWEKVKESSKGITSSLHDAEACCKEVDFAPTNYREKREMAEKGITTQYKINQYKIKHKEIIWILIFYMERKHRDSYKRSTLSTILIRLSYTSHRQ